VREGVGVAGLSAAGSTGGGRGGRVHGRRGGRKGGRGRGIFIVEAICGFGKC
jgi:hypothetical protein